MNDLDHMKHLIQLVESAEQLDEINFKKAAATALAVGSMAGADLSADPGAIPGTEPEANPEYNIQADDTRVKKANLEQYMEPLKKLAVTFMKQQKYFSGIWPSGMAGPKIIDNSGKINIVPTNITANTITFKIRYAEAFFGGTPPMPNNVAEVTISLGVPSRGDQITTTSSGAKGYEINRPSPTTITSVKLDVLNDDAGDLKRMVWQKFGKKVPHLSDKTYTKKGEMQRDGLYELIGLDIDPSTTMAQGPK